MGSGQSSDPLASAASIEMIHSVHVCMLYALHTYQSIKLEGRGNDIISREATCKCTSITMCPTTIVPGSNPSKFRTSSTPNSMYEIVLPSPWIFFRQARAVLRNQPLASRLPQSIHLLLSHCGAQLPDPVTRYVVASGHPSSSSWRAVPRLATHSSGPLIQQQHSLNSCQPTTPNNPLFSNLPCKSADIGRSFPEQFSSRASTESALITDSIADAPA
ncbi:hypothetical protein VTI28DRAFT_7902 [Corynascus sepedonium]